MKQQNEVELYAHLLYSVRKRLDVSANEYWYLDMVYQLSRRGWCTKSLEHCADDIGISKRGIIKLRDRLLARDLLKKNRSGHLKVTSKYIEVAVNKVHLSEDVVVNLIPQSVNKVHSAGEPSATKTNKRLTENNTAFDENGPGYRAALAAKEKLLRKMSLR